MRYAGEKKLNIWVAMALGILALFLLFVVYPLVLVLYKSVLSEDGNLSFAYFTKFFARKYYWSTLVNSFKVTIVSTVVAAVLGLAMAYVLRSVQIIQHPDDSDDRYNSYKQPSVGITWFQEFGKRHIHRYGLGIGNACTDWSAY